MTEYTATLQKIESYLQSSDINRPFVTWLRLQWMLELWPQTYPPTAPDDQARVEAFARALEKVQAAMHAMKPEEWFYEI